MDYIFDNNKTTLEGRQNEYDNMSCLILYNMNDRRIYKYIYFFKQNINKFLKELIKGFY